MKTILYRLTLFVGVINAVQTATDSPWTESPSIKVNGSFVQAYLALDSFQNWTITTLKRLIDFDQATLFSGYGMYVNCRPVEREILKLLITLHGVPRIVTHCFFRIVVEWGHMHCALPKFNN